MRILIVRALPVVTTAAVHAVAVANELVARGHEVFFVSGSSAIPAGPTNGLFRKQQRSFRLRLAQFASLVRCLYKHRIEVVHVYSRAAMWVSWFAARFAGVPMIRIHDVAEPMPPGPPTTPKIGDRDVPIAAASERTPSRLASAMSPPVDDMPLRADSLPFGASSAVGLLTVNRLNSLPPAFGDSAFGLRQFGRVFVKADPRDAVHAYGPLPGRFAEGQTTNALNHAVNRLEHTYRSAYVNFYRREIPILCYHRLVDRRDSCGKFATHVWVERFEQQLRYLRDHGYRTLHFSDLNPARVFSREERGVILTFDDGYEDNYRLLFPLLQKYNAKATIYLVSGCETNAWDVSKGEKSLRLMNQSQRHEMLASGLVEFGAHSITHCDLSAVSDEHADREILQSKLELEASLGVAVNTFAYPYGHLNAHVKERVRQAGFQFGVATDSGPLALHEDPFQVRRIVIFPGTTLRSFGRKVSGGYTFYRTNA